ncbi:carbon storage regulator CsrA [Paenibacillus sp. OAS669]|uniref:carbon storage regulator CsrA n=1 Tax=Paenibacillus sp. OAS669 TaxID=2663821 RepID=UPI00178C08D7|nr:carbon storage regulator CsrA [Paenibacillus sp. OAS669]MBE1447430.1 carbon storage regulator [Paenibacillus sp. OAS669]
MLVLSRKKGESLMIGDQIEIVVLAAEGDTIKLGIQAPRNIEVLRKEVYELIQNSNAEASLHSPDLGELKEMIKKRGK